VHAHTPTSCAPNGSNLRIDESATPAVLGENYKFGSPATYNLDPIYPSIRPSIPSDAVPYLLLLQGSGVFIPARAEILWSSAWCIYNVVKVGRGEGGVYVIYHIITNLTVRRASFVGVQVLFFLC